MAAAFLYTTYVLLLQIKSRFDKHFTSDRSNRHILLQFMSLFTSQLIKQFKYFLNKIMFIFISSPLNSFFAIKNLLRITEKMWKYERSSLGKTNLNFSIFLVSFKRNRVYFTFEDVIVEMINHFSFQIPNKKM